MLTSERACLQADRPAPGLAAVGAAAGGPRAGVGARGAAAGQRRAARRAGLAATPRRRRQVCFSLIECIWRLPRIPSKTWEGCIIQGALPAFAVKYQQ